MKITKTGSKDSTTFVLTGRLDAGTSPKFESELIPECENIKDITIIFKEVEYVSSAGLRVLLMGNNVAKDHGGKVTLKNVSAEIMKTFHMTGFSEIFNFE